MVCGKNNDMYVCKSMWRSSDEGIVYCATSYSLVFTCESSNKCVVTAADFSSIRKPVKESIPATAAELTRTGIRPTSLTPGTKPTWNETSRAGLVYPVPAITNPVSQTTSRVSGSYDTCSAAGSIFCFHCTFAGKEARTDTFSISFPLDVTDQLIVYVDSLPARGGSGPVFANTPSR